MWSPTHVQVTVCRAKGLLTKGKNGTNDAFVTIALGKEKFQTSVKQKALPDEEWQEECELPIPTQGNTAEVVLTVYHQNFIGVDEFLGMVSIPLSHFDVYERPKSKFYTLKSKPGQESKTKSRGELEVRVGFTVKSGSLLELSKKEKIKGSLGQINQTVHSIGGSLLSLGGKERKGLKKLASTVGHKLKMPGRSSRDEKSEGRLSRHSSGRFSDKYSSGEPDPGVISEDEDEFRFDELSHKSSGSSINLAGSQASGSLENLGGGELVRRNSMNRGGTLPSRLATVNSANLSNSGAAKSAAFGSTKNVSSSETDNEWNRKLFGKQSKVKSFREEPEPAAPSSPIGGVPSIIIQDSFVLEDHLFPSPFLSDKSKKKVNKAGTSDEVSQKIEEQVPQPQSAFLPDAHLARFVDDVPPSQTDFAEQVPIPPTKSEEKVQSPADEPVTVPLPKEESQSLADEPVMVPVPKPRSDGGGMRRRVAEQLSDPQSQQEEVPISTLGYAAAVPIPQPVSVEEVQFPQSFFEEVSIPAGGDVVESPARFDEQVPIPQTRSVEQVSDPLVSFAEQMPTKPVRFADVPAKPPRRAEEVPAPSAKVAEESTGRQDVPVPQSVSIEEGALPPTEALDRAASVPETPSIALAHQSTPTVGDDSGSSLPKVPQRKDLAANAGEADVVSMPKFFYPTLSVHPSDTHSPIAVASHSEPPVPKPRSLLYVDSRPEQSLRSESREAGELDSSPPVDCLATPVLPQSDSELCLAKADGCEPFQRGCLDGFAGVETQMLDAVQSEESLIRVGRLADRDPPESLLIDPVNEQVVHIEGEQLAEEVAGRLMDEAVLVNDYCSIPGDAAPNSVTEPQECADVLPENSAVDLSLDTMFDLLVDEDSKDPVNKSIERIFDQLVENECSSTADYSADSVGKLADSVDVGSAVQIEIRIEDSSAGFQFIDLCPSPTEEERYLKVDRFPAGTGVFGVSKLSDIEERSEPSFDDPMNLTDERMHLTREIVSEPPSGERMNRTNVIYGDERLFSEETVCFASSPVDLSTRVPVTNRQLTADVEEVKRKRISLGPSLKGLVLDEYGASQTDGEDSLKNIDSSSSPVTADDNVIELFSDMDKISPVEKAGDRPDYHTPFTDRARNKRLYSLFSTPNSQVGTDESVSDSVEVIHLDWMESEHDSASQGFVGSEHICKSSDHVTSPAESSVKEAKVAVRNEVAANQVERESPGKQVLSPPVCETSSLMDGPRVDLSWDNYDICHYPTPEDVGCGQLPRKKKISLAPTLKSLTLDTAEDSNSDIESPIMEEQAAENHRMKMAASFHQRVVVGEEMSANQSKDFNPNSISTAAHKSIHAQYQGKTREELVRVVEDRDKEIQNLKEYIDTLLLRVMDTCPTVLQTPFKKNPSKK